MRSDERVKCAFAHKEPDTVPILEFVYSRNFFKEVVGTVPEGRRMLDAFRAAGAKGGGYILASDHSVHDDVPNENVFALYEAGRKYGKYPISL